MSKNYNNLIIVINYFVCVIFLLIFSINTALAIPASSDLQSGKFGLTNTAQQSGFNTGSGSSSTGPTELPTIANITGDIIGIVLSLLGVIFMVLIIYSGFLWMTARGNEENAQKAKAIMTNAVIGIVIIFTAYAITNLLIESLYKATTVKASYLQHV